MVTLSLPSFDSFPERVLNDAKCGNLLNDVLIWRVESRHSPFVYEVFAISEPVEHQATDVHLIVKNLPPFGGAHGSPFLAKAALVDPVCPAH